LHQTTNLEAIGHAGLVSSAKPNTTTAPTATPHGAFMPAYIPVIAELRAQPQESACALYGKCASKTSHNPLTIKLCV